MSAPVIRDIPPGYDSRPVRPLTHDEIKGVLSREIDDALGGLGSELSEERRRALQFYYGKPFGNEQEGRSSVVLTDVTDTIEWSMPNLMLMLADSHIIARFHPTKPEEEEAADQATEYINHVFLNECRGWELLYEWFKTGLLEKNGFVKVYVEERVEPKVDTYYGLDEEQVGLVLSEEGTEAIEHTARVESIDGVPMELYDLKVRTRRPERRIRIDGIPPEECLTARRLIDFDDEVPFMAHRKKVTVSQLIAQGYDADTVAALPSDDTPEYEQARVERLSEDETFPVTTAERADAASREIWLTECYIRIDEDGDGYAELRKITVVGENALTILDDEIINWNPFAYLCPIPMPHKFYGLSVADLVMDLQLIRSTLLRQTLDNLYLTNNSRVAVVEGRVNLDDLMVSRPGGIVRVREQGAVEPLAVQPHGPMAMNMLEFLEGVKENRTGITRYNQGLDSSSLNKTATGVTRIMNASYARLQLVAKVYAEVGMKQLFRLLLRSMVEGGMRKRVVKLRGEWVTVDPSTWNADMNVQVEVGLGVGQAAERVDNIQRVLEIQGALHERGFGGYMVEPQHVYNAVSDLTDAIAVTGGPPDRYFSDPRKKGPPPPEPPDPEMVKEQNQQQDRQVARQLEQGELARHQSADAELANFRKLELEEKMALERDKLAQEKEIALAELESKERIEREKIKAQKAAAEAAARKERSDGDSEGSGE
jgi:hypothetical protein